MIWHGICPFWDAGAFGAWSWIWVALNWVFWAAMFGGTIFLFRWIVSRAGSASQSAVSRSAPLTAVQIVRERYARGEIERDEYLNLIEDLK